MKEYLYNLATDKRRGIDASFLKFFLLLGSFLYGALIRGLILVYAFRPAKLGCKVISVGNITLGGTGKTSLVEFVSRYLRDKGHKIAILSRGYKKLRQEMGDEPLMLLRNLGDVPVIVDRDRVRGAKRAVQEYGVDTVILDDGMQQWRLKKDLDIVTISVPQGFGNQHMLPRGILRQPLASLKDTHIFVLTKVSSGSSLKKIKDTLSQINPATPVVESVHEPLGFYDINHPDELLKLNYLSGKSIGLFSGIADPDSFANLISGLGIKIGLDLRFGDHHNYSEEDLFGIATKCAKESLGIILTTEKDAVRISEAKLKLFEGYQLLVLRIALKITKNEEQLFNRLLSLYSF
ncbi:MAG: tetraacyldisaccharide 4'-kinase [Candidatus Omnitrophota bacterium]|nr:tetraacyldisaccharide 4'-kinase [Candidatus Omnitrophota bacterium]